MAPHPSLWGTTALGRQMLADLPPFLQTDPDIQAAIYCKAKEIDRLDARAEDVRAQLNPLTATEPGLPLWEAMFYLPTNPADSVSARQARIIRRIRSLIGNPAGLEWIQRITDRIGATWSYEEHIPGDGSTPPAQTLRVSLTPAPGDPAYEWQKRVVREETPAELALSFSGAGGGFTLDESHMDSDTFGGI